MEGDERKAEKGDGEGEGPPILYEEADKRKQNNSQGKGGLDEEDLLKLLVYLQTKPAWLFQRLLSWTHPQVR